MFITFSTRTNLLLLLFLLLPQTNRKTFGCGFFQFSFVFCYCMFFLGSNPLSSLLWWLWVLGMANGDQTFWQLWVTHWLTWLVFSKITLYFVTTCSSLWQKGIIISSPFHTWLTSLSPSFIYCLCYSTNYLCLFVYLSLSFSSTHNSRSQ
jgi:hypothetical protein